MARIKTINDANSNLWEWEIMGYSSASRRKESLMVRKVGHHFVSDYTITNLYSKV